MNSLDFIYFGGAFDPIHVGHMDAVQIVRESFPHSKVTLVPGFMIPTADGGVKSPATPFVDRVAMAVIAFDEWPLVDVTSLEEELPSPNFTYQTLEALAGDLTSAKVGWMIGADQLAAFLHWKNPRRILELASLVVLPRPAATSTDTLEMAQSVATGLGFSVSVDAKNLRVDLDGGGSIYVMPRAPRSVSSTEIRRLAAESLKKLDGLIAQPVIDYIADLGLYQHFAEDAGTSS